MNAISTRLNTASSIAVGGNIPVGNVTHRSGCALKAYGNTWIVNGSGYYKVTASVTYQPTTLTETTLSLNANGNTIGQATATPAVAGDSINLTLIGLVLGKCGCAENDITVSTDVAGVVTESDVIIEKL